MDQLIFLLLHLLLLLVVTPYLLGLPNDSEEGMREKRPFDDDVGVALVECCHGFVLPVLSRTSGWRPRMAWAAK